ncbi:MAG: hypothetical protein BWY83_00772 [bacterium ADurb.Bin478]|nr:MAG: hypothetical protein BWY83_00772 [bacterium ADurb.Bin478]
MDQIDSVLRQFEQFAERSRIMIGAENKTALAVYHQRSIFIDRALAKAAEGDQQQAESKDSFLHRSSWVSIDLFTDLSAFPVAEDLFQPAVRHNLLFDEFLSR